MATGRPLVVQFAQNHIRGNLSCMVDDFESLSEKLARTTTECDRLREENLRLRELLDEAREQPREPLIDRPEMQQRSDVGSPEANKPRPLVATISPELSVREKIALFRSLFHGREDVY